MSLWQGSPPNERFVRALREGNLDNAAAAYSSYNRAYTQNTKEGFIHSTYTPLWLDDAGNTITNVTIVGEYWRFGLLVRVRITGDVTAGGPTPVVSGNDFRFTLPSWMSEGLIPVNEQNICNSQSYVFDSSLSRLFPGYCRVTNNGTELEPRVWNAYFGSYQFGGINDTRLYTDDTNMNIPPASGDTIVLDVTLDVKPTINN